MFIQRKPQEKIFVCLLGKENIMTITIVILLFVSLFSSYMFYHDSKAGRGFDHSVKNLFFSFISFVLSGILFFCLIWLHVSVSVHFR